MNTHNLAYAFPVVFLISSMALAFIIVTIDDIKEYRKNREYYRARDAKIAASRK